MKLILTTVVASGLLANVAQACSCGEGDESGFLWQGLNTVPRNLAAFPWEGGEAHDRTSLPSKQDFHLERLRQGSAPQAVDFVLERADAIFPDRTIPDFLLDGASVRDGLLYFKGRNGKDEVWPRPVIAVLRPTATLLAGATYRLTYDRAPVVDMFGNNPRSRPPQILTFTVGKEDGPSAQAESASIEVGEQKIESLTVSTRKGSCATTISAASRKVRLKLQRRWRNGANSCSTRPRLMGEVGVPLPASASKSLTARAGSGRASIFSMQAAVEVNRQTTFQKVRTRLNWRRGSPEPPRL